MATVVGSLTNTEPFSLEGKTHKQAAKLVFGNLRAWESRFSTLKAAIAKTPEEVQEIALQHMADKDLAALTTLLNKSYEYYKIVLDQSDAALAVLNPLDEQFQKTVNYCTPKAMSLSPEHLEDLTKHGYDMKAYPAKELELAESSNLLLLESRKIQAAIHNIKAFITHCPHAMNGAARAVKQSHRDKTWGDLLPEKFVGETKYFMEGFQAFQKQTTKLQGSTIEGPATTADTASTSAPKEIATIDG